MSIVGKPALLQHTFTLLQLLFEMRFGTRRLRLWLTFLLLVSIVPLTLIVIVQSSAVTNPVVTIPPKSYNPVSIGTYSQEALANWRADPSLLGYGPENNVSATLFETVCDRLGVAFEHTVLIPDEDAAQQAGKKGFDAVLFFFEGENRTEDFRIFFNQFNVYGVTSDVSVYKSAKVLQDLGGHQRSVVEIFAASGYYLLQIAASNVLLEQQGLTPLSYENPSLSLWRLSDAQTDIIDYAGIYTVVIGIPIFVIFGMGVALFSAVYNASVMMSSKVRLVLESKGAHRFAFPTSWFIMSGFIGTVIAVLLTMVLYASTALAKTSFGIVLAVLVLYAWCQAALTVLVFSVFGISPILSSFGAILSLLVLVAGSVVFIILSLGVEVVFGGSILISGSLGALFLAPPLPVVYVLYTALVSETDTTRTFDDLAPETGLAVGMLLVDIALIWVVILVAEKAKDFVVVKWCYVNIGAMYVGVPTFTVRLSSQALSIKGSSNEKSPGIYAKNILKVYRAYEEVVVMDMKRSSKGPKKVPTKVRKPKKLFAVNNMDLVVEQGEVFVLLGQNGAGKSTMFNILTGSTRPTGGAVEYVHDDPNIGFCPQHDLVLEHLTCAKQLKILGEIAGLSSQEAAENASSLLTRLGIQHKADMPPSTMSGGQRRRLSVALAFSGKSNVLFMDEPTTGLDVVNRREVWKLVREEKSKGKTVILTTHSMEEAEALADRIGIMSEGKLQALGTSIELRRHFGPWYHLACICKANARDFKVEAVVEFVQQFIPSAKLLSFHGSKISLNLPTEHVQVFPDFLEELDKQKAKYGISSFSISPSTLNDVFLRLAKIKENTSEPEEEEETEEGETLALNVEGVTAENSTAIFNADLLPTKLKQAQYLFKLLRLAALRSPDAFAGVIFNIVLMSCLAGALNFAFTQEESTQHYPLQTFDNVSYSSFLADVGLAGGFLGDRAGTFIPLDNLTYPLFGTLAFPFINATQAQIIIPFFAIGQRGAKSVHRAHIFTDCCLANDWRKRP